MMRPGAMEGRDMDIRKPQEADGSGPIESPGDLQTEEGRLGGGATDSGPAPGRPVRGVDRTDGRAPSADEEELSMVTDIPGVTLRAAGSGPDRREPAWSWEGDGSRYRLEGHRPSLVIIVGWDRPLATYFLQVWDGAASAGEHEGGGQRVWGGGAGGGRRGGGDPGDAPSPF